MSTAVGTKQHKLEDLETVKFVVSALFDISVERLGRLRAEFQKNQKFYVDISELYANIKQTMKEHGDLRKKTTNVKKKIFIAFTSNARFYGSINSDVMRYFLEGIKNADDTDALVIGSTGKGFLENSSNAFPSVPSIVFAGDRPTKKEIKKFLEQVAGYEEVHIFYPSFVSVFSQKISEIDITHTASKSESKKTEPMEYIFEPELPKILTFFETRIRYLLFSRIVLESELARTAARIFSINRAQDRANKQIKTVRRAIQKDVDTFNDLRLLESFAAISKWKK
ncbi:hypothetical protein MNBD_CPR01-589 [hydrothermal vent metagenome]|uniref:ATP synthase gamma chain n=1 Tax=hydrothermal vent metagenome TaxID=652676 RepID=A0A3B0UPL3_9ZZZZ